MRVFSKVRGETRTVRAPLAEKLLLTAFLLVLSALPAAAQTQTAVSATITDPNGIPYANGTYSIQLIPTGNNPSVGGAAIQGAFNGSLSATGSFSASLWPNASITPASTQWSFTICSNSGGIQPPLGTGTQCTPPTAITISGTVQVLTTTLSNVAPKLTNFITGGTGSVTSVAATSPVVVTPSPITTTGTISCPTCNTSGATIAGSIANTQVAFGTAANTIGGNAGFIFVTPNLTIPTNGAYQINGAQAIALPVPANSNLAAGPSALAAVTTGFNNVAVGPSAETLTTSGNANTALGTGALQSEGATNIKNTGIGTGALQSATSDANTAIGQGALQVATSGGSNIAVGAGTGGNLTTGGSNTLLGTGAGLNMTTGSNDIIIGAGNGNVVTSGSNNVAIGNTIAGLTMTSSNQLSIMDVILGTGMNVPATSTVEYKGNLKVDGTCTGCSSSGVTSFSGDGTVITNSASTGAVTASIAGTSGGQPYFNSATSWASTGVLANHAIQTGGGAGGAPTTGNGDFTIDSTAHTLLASAAGLVDLSAETGSNAFKIPAQPGCTASANGSMCFNTSTGNLLVSGNFSPHMTSIPGTNCLFRNGSASGALLICSALVDAGTNVVSSEPISATAYLTATNCSSSAAPAVCGSAAAGSVVIAAAGTTVTVNTTAVTANSQIDVTPDDTLGTKLSVTCNSTIATLIGGLAITARTAGTSFQITSGATPAVNPLCISYHITN